MIKQFSLSAMLVGLAAQTLAATPDVPNDIKAPAGEKVILEAHASGSQIYLCQPGSDGKPQWTLKAPEAELHDQKGALIGTHYAGPTWKHQDGSEVVGKAAAKVNAPETTAIPWLLVSAVSHSGSGVFAKVTSIQRIHTKGGQPPPATDCDSAKLNTEAKSAYSADYVFYAPAK